MIVGRATKIIQEVYLYRAPALRSVKKWFYGFWNGNFNENDKINFGWFSDFNNDLILDLVNNKSQITTEEITERLNADNLANFWHLKKLGYKFEIWCIGNPTGIFSITMY